MKYELLIKKGIIVQSDRIFRADIGIRNGKILQIESDITDDYKRVIDAERCYVLPGLIDPHTHLGIPVKNTQSVDDFDSGTKAAACGGVTTIIDFTVQKKGESLLKSIQRRKIEAQKSNVNYLLHCNVTDFPKNPEQEIKKVFAEGIKSFKVFLTYKEAGMMISCENFRTLAEIIKENKGTLLIHAEKNDLVESATQKLILQGKTSPKYHPQSRPNIVEQEGIRQALDWNRDIECSLYFVHISTKQGINEIIKERQRTSYPIYAETCPQYLILDDSVYESEDARYFITTPPIRSKEDREVLCNKVIEGCFDTIGTDHCPFTKQQKEVSDKFYEIPNGLSGIETRLPLLYTYFVRRGRMDISSLVKITSKNPARIFGLFPKKGIIIKGSDADLVILDPLYKTKLTAKMLHSQTDFCPYEAMDVYGYPKMTILGGEVIAEKGEFL